MKCMMDHIVLNVKDEEKMIVFYSEVLMLSPERLEEYRAGKIPFPSVRINSDTVIDLFPEKMWRKNPVSGDGHLNLNHLCLSMNKKAWDDLLERLKISKIEIEEGPAQRWGAHGTGTSVYFRDPEGNLVEARYYESQNDAEKCMLGS